MIILWPDQVNDERKTYKALRVKLKAFKAAVIFVILI